MAPPPNSGDATNKNNEEDPLGGMDPMAWLESLAARQGAKPEELVTAANLEIPLPPADTVIDEPGYTPGYEMSKPAAKPEPEPVQAVEPEAPPPPTPELEPVAAAPADDLLGGMDPMAWLESLAARQGAKPEELVTAADLEIPLPPADTVIDEPGYTPGYEMSKPAAAKPEPEPVQAVEPETPPPPAPEPEPMAAVPADDLLGGMDPMAWLESLAARQGAKPEELITAADLEIPLPPADTVIDEPGYVDYDPFGSGVSRPVETIKVPEKPAAPPPTPVPEPEPAMPTDDLLGGMDALTWLESLTTTPEAGAVEAAQSDSTDKLPVMDTSTGEPVGQRFFTEEAETEPGMSLEEAAAILGTGASEAPPTTDDLLGGMDPLAWLESLAARQGANPEELVTGGKLELPAAPSTGETTEYSPFAATPDLTGASMEPESALSWLEELAREQTQPLSAVPPEAVPAAEMPPQEAGGASADITEVQAWLDEQARSLELKRAQLEAEEAAAGEVPPAEAGEVPSWLLESMPQGPTEVPATPALSENIAFPVAPEDLPSWLTQPEAEAAPDLNADFLASLAASAPPAAPLPEEPRLATSELEALTRPASPMDVDSWAEALDEEYERLQAGDESVPEWYQEAIARAETEPPTKPTPTTAEAAPAPAAGPTPTMPDWLSEVSAAEEPAAALPGEIPDWLRGVSPAPVPSAPTPPSTGVTIEPAELPDWLRPTPAEPVKEPEPAPPVQAVQEQVPVTPPKAPEPTPVPRVPEPVPIRAPEAVPAEYQARLKQARELVTADQQPASMVHYQALIDASVLLEETRGDLRDLVEKVPSDPRLRRMLGDTHMRLGDLQAALDTYRSALDQL